MYGNVAEWCLDHYTPRILRKTPAGQADAASGAAADGQALPACGPRRLVGRRAGQLPQRRAARLGANWIVQDPQRPHSIWWLTDADFVGFRVVRAVEEQDNLKNLRSKVTKQSR